MENYFNKLGINEVQDQLSIIISNMSEAEIQNFWIVYPKREYKNS